MRKMTIPTSAAGVVAALAVAADAAAQAPLPITGELQVNSYTTGSQSGARVGMADNGTHVVVWGSQGQDGDGGSIRYRRFPGDGTAPEAEAAANLLTAGDQIRPAVDVNANLDWVVAWESEVEGLGIRARRTSNNGAAISVELAASEQTGAGTQFPAAGRADDDSFVLVWELAADAWLRVFDSTGSPVTGDRPVAPSRSASYRPDVAAHADGAFVVAFVSDDADGHGVFAQRFDAAGDEIAGILPVSVTSDGDQGFAAAASTSGGGFVVAWRDDLLGVRFRRFAADGSALGGEIDPGGSATASLPAIEAGPGGGFVVAMVDAGGIAAREYDRLGRPVSDLFQVNVTTAGLQDSPGVGIGRDRFVVTWHTANLDGDSLAVARRLYRLRSVFADDFESGGTSAWSSVAP